MNDEDPAAINAKCGHCGGGLDEGFVRDTSSESGVNLRWAPGLAERDEDTVAADVPIRAFRCSVCFHLELYALGGATP